MYIFVEPVTEAQVDEIQSGNNARIEEIERKLLGHDDSESQEGVGWADLTAGVQAAIAEDEVSVINADDDQANAEKDYNEGQESRGPKAEEQEQEQERNVKREQQTVGQDEELGEEDVDEEVDRSTEETREDEDYNETGHIDSHSTQNDQGPQLVESQRPDAGVDLDNSATEESITKADSDFLDSIAEETPSSAKPEILAMTLTIRNKVNDKYTLRPNALGADDRWEVEYSLTEVPSQERAWSLYRACQVRRQKKLEHEPEDEDSETPYIQMLRKISQNGAEWRRQMDEQEKERPRAVIRQTEVVDE